MKLILDLCGGTGSWSKPYKDAGYFVDLVTLPFRDVRVLAVSSMQPVYGILAAPPCTTFTKASAWNWNNYDANGSTIESMSIVIAILKIIALAKPTFWAIENPPGRLRHLLGDPTFTFTPCDFGDPYTKTTHLWGVFNKPVKTPVAVTNPLYIQNMPQTKNRSMLRSITPSGFATAFYEANK